MGKASTTAASCRRSFITGSAAEAAEAAAEAAEEAEAAEGDSETAAAATTAGAGAAAEFDSETAEATFEKSTRTENEDEINGKEDKEEQ